MRNFYFKACSTENSLVRVARFLAGRIESLSVRMACFLAWCIESSSVRVARFFVGCIESASVRVARFFAGCIENRKPKHLKSLPSFSNTYRYSFAKKSNSASFILSLSLSVRLDPEGRHKPLSNKVSATVVP